MTPATVNAAMRGMTRPSMTRGTSTRTASPVSTPRFEREHAAEQDAARAGHEILERAAVDDAVQDPKPRPPRPAGCRARRPAADSRRPRACLRAARTASRPRRPARSRSAAASSCQSARPCGRRHRRVRAQREQPRPRLGLEAVQHRQNDDQRRDAEREAEQRRRGPERHERAPAPRAQVAQADEPFEGLKHEPRIKP